MKAKASVDIVKVEGALKRAARAAVSGSNEARSGRFKARSSAGKPAASNSAPDNPMPARRKRADADKDH